MKPSMTGCDTAEFKIMLYLCIKSQFADLGLNCSSSRLNFRQVHTSGCPNVLKLFVQDNYSMAVFSSQFECVQGV